MNSYNNKKQIFFNCKIVTENDVLLNHAIIVSNDSIENIVSEEIISSFNANFVNCNGDYILPGLIDIHSDVIEKIIVPRKSVLFNNRIALNEIDRQSMLQGITTIYHSISIAESTICNNKRTLKLDNMFDLCNLIDKHKMDLSINHKFHARYELNSINAFDYTFNALCEGKIHELSFMDHTPGQGQYKDLNVFKKVIQQQYGLVSEERKKEIINICQSKPKLESDKLNNLIQKANELKVPMAYHDVDSVEQVSWMLDNNIKICEFPLNNDIAMYASKKHMFSIVGAPNILLGHSHYNNANATTLLLNGNANVICSDYFSPSLLLSIFKLNNEYGIPLPYAVNFATLNPAKAVNISDNYGSIAVGKKADFIIVHYSNSIPKVTKVIVSGKLKLDMFI